MAQFFLMPILLLMAGVPSEAPDSEGARFGEAVAALDAQIMAMDQAASPPRANDPKVAPMFKTIAETMESFGTPAFPAAGMSTMNSFCDPLSRIKIRYLLWGTKGRTLADANTRAFDPAMSANMLKYQNELAVLDGAQAICLARHLPELESYIASLPPEQRTETRLAAIRSLRDHLAKGFANQMSMLTIPQISMENRRVAAHFIALSFDAIVTRLTIAQRQTTIALLAPYAKRFPIEFVPLYRRVQSALTSTSCTGLCLTA